jgi:GrpB-like predicted nucleotidyltransferase (UPF0157 family)
MASKRCYVNRGDGTPIELFLSCCAEIADLAMKLLRASKDVYATDNTQMITILPYRPSWSVEFAALGVEVRKILGSLALRIDHIGSTSVPGLAAKDVIDIQVTVVNLEKIIEHALRHAGYCQLEHISRDHVPPGWSQKDEEWAKWFFKSDSDQRPVNLHVRISGRANQRYRYFGITCEHTNPSLRHMHK